MARQDEVNGAGNSSSRSTQPGRRIGRDFQGSNERSNSLGRPDDVKMAPWARFSMTDTLAKISGDVISCERCPRLRGYCRQVARQKRRMYLHEEYWGKPVPGFGDPQAKLLVIGLAPAAHGGNRTGRVFTGDRSGDWLYAALHAYGFANQPISRNRNDGLKLVGAYVTAAARCAPPGNKPTCEEFANCREYLVRELKLLSRVRVILCLGKVALDNYWLARAEQGLGVPCPRFQFRHGAEWRAPEGITLLCSYHPSQQNTQTGKLTRSMFHAVLTRTRELCGQDKADR